MSNLFSALWRRLDELARTTPLFKHVAVVYVRVSNLDTGIRFYEDLGHKLLWNNGYSAGLRMQYGETELVLTTALDFEFEIMVDNVDTAIERFVNAGGSVVMSPEGIPGGKLAIVRDPFGNEFGLVGMSRDIATPIGLLMDGAP